MTVSTDKIPSGLRLPMIGDRSTIDTFGNCQSQVFSLGVSQQYASNNKSVTNLTQNQPNSFRDSHYMVLPQSFKSHLNLTQLVIEVAREWFKQLIKKGLLPKSVYIQIPKKGFRPEISHYSSEKLQKPKLLQRNPFLTLLYYTTTLPWSYTSKVNQLIN